MFTRQISITSDEKVSSEDDNDTELDNEGNTNVDDIFVDMFELSQEEFSDFFQQYSQRPLDDDDSDGDDTEVDRPNKRKTIKGEEHSNKSPENYLKFTDDKLNVKQQELQQLTLTQAFLSKTSGSSRKRSKIIPASEKKRQQTDQQTLTQNFDSRSTVNGRTFSNEIPRLKDSKDTVYLLTLDGVHRVFKNGEVFVINRRDYSDSICEIKSFTTKITKNGATIKCANALIFQKLKKTYAGDIKNEEMFQKYIKRVDLDGNQYVQHKDEQKVPLRHLGKRVHDFEKPSSYLIYEKFDASKASFGLEGHGFTISYRHYNGGDNDGIDDSPSWANLLEDIDFDKFDKENEARLAIAKKASVHQKAIAHSPERHCPFEMLDRAIEDIDKTYGPAVASSLHKASEALKTEMNDQASCLALSEAENKANLNKMESLKEELSSLRKESIYKKKDEVKIPVLDVFAGIGGMSHGFIEAGGFDVKWAIEKNHSAAAMYKLNHDDTFMFEEDVKIWLAKMKRILKENGSKKRNDNNPYLQVLNAQHLHFSPVSNAS